MRGSAGRSGQLSLPESACGKLTYEGEGKSLICKQQLFDWVFIFKKKQKQKQISVAFAMFQNGQGSYNRQDETLLQLKIL